MPVIFNRATHPPVKTGLCLGLPINLFRVMMNTKVMENTKHSTHKALCARHRVTTNAGYPQYLGCP